MLLHDLLLRIKVVESKVEGRCGRTQALVLGSCGHQRRNGSPAEDHHEAHLSRAAKLAIHLQV